MARPWEASFPRSKAFGFSVGLWWRAGECGLPHLWREAAGGGKGRAASPFCLAPLGAFGGETVLSLMARFTWVEC